MGVCATGAALVHFRSPTISVQLSYSFFDRLSTDFFRYTNLEAPKSERHLEKRDLTV